MSALKQMKAVHVEGRGETRSTPLLLLHGIGNGSWVWKRDQQAMADAGFSSWAVDLPGHGADAASNPSLADLRDCVIDALGEFDEPVCLVGHSMGGLVAQMVAAVAEVHSVVLICSAPPREVRNFPQRHHIAPGLPRVLPALLGRPVDFRGQAYREIGFNCIPEADHDAIESQLTDWPNRLSKQLLLRRPSVEPLTCPLLVTCGLQDRLIPTRVARLIGDYHNNAVTWRFDDVGHFPQFEAGGVRLMEAVLDWIKAPQRRKVLEIEAFSPKEGVGSKTRNDRTPHPERSDSRWKGRFKGRG